MGLLAYRKTCRQRLPCFLRLVYHLQERIEDEIKAVGGGALARDGTSGTILRLSENRLPTTRGNHFIYHVPPFLLPTGLRRLMD